MRCISFGDLLQAMWYRNRKTAIEKFGKKTQLDLFMSLGQNYVKLKVTCKCGHVHKMLLLIMPLGLENILTKMNFTDSALLEK